MKSLCRVLSLCLCLSFLFSAASFGGPRDTGGGSPTTVTAGAIKLLIESGGLKQAMLGYVQTLPLEQVEDAQVRGLLKDLAPKSKLGHDIESSSYVIANASLQCRDAYDQAVPASTRVGKIGSQVCFNVDKLAASYRGLGDEDLMVQLASLAFHEHIHHFQTFSQDAIKKNEADANRVAGYILITAKFVQLPILKWTRPGSGPAEFQAIQSLYNLIRAKEQAFLAPKLSSYKDYPDFQGKNDRGIIRLLPRETYEDKISVRGGGAYFSFSRLTHEYGYGSDLELSQHQLSVGFAGCDFGYLIDLGTVVLSSVTGSLAELQFLQDIKPVDGNEPANRKLQDDSMRGLNANGYFYSNQISRVAVGHTYALRSVNFGTSDVLVAFRIVGAEDDGSLTIAWKMIKQFPKVNCSN